MSEKTIRELILDTKRTYTINTGAEVTPLMLFYSQKEDNGISYTLEFFEKDYDSQVSTSEREMLKTFIEIAQNLIDGKVEPEINWRIGKNK